MKSFSKFKRVLAVVCASLSFAITTSCSAGGTYSGDVIQTGNRNIVSIEIVEESVPEFIVVGKLDEAGIKARVYYSDETSEVISVTTALIPEQYRSLLESAGDVTVDLFFRGVSTQLKIRIVEATSVVKFYAYDENCDYQEIATQTVEAGKGATAPTNIEDVYGGGYCYTFREWDRPFDHVLQNLNVYALYDAIGTFTVTFYNGDGKAISVQTVARGDDAQEPSESERAMDGKEFVGWDRSYFNVQSDLSVYGLYVSAGSEPLPSSPSGPISPLDPSIDYDALAQQAYSSVSALFDTWSQTGITLDQEVPLKTFVGAYIVQIEYTVSSKAEAYLRLDGNKLAVTTDEEEHIFDDAITARFFFEKRELYSKKLDVKVLAVSRISSVWELQNNDHVITRGKVTALRGSSFFMQDGVTGTEVYSSKDTGVKVGDYVEVAGTFIIYQGLCEVKTGTVTILPDNGGVEEPVNIELGAQTDISAAKLVGGRVFTATDLYVKQISLGHGSSGYYYIQGTVIADGENGTKKVAVRIEDRYASKEMMESWGVIYDEQGNVTLGDNIQAGDLITLGGVFNWYNGPQICLGTIAALKKAEPPADPVDIPATFAEVLEAGKKLADGDSSYDYYVFDAYVVKNTGTNYFLGATADAGTSDDKALFEIYKASEANQAKLLKGAKVTVRTRIKNYHGQIEDAGNSTLTITVVEAGEAWVANYTEVTVAQAIAAALALEDGKTSTEFYKVTGYIVKVIYAWSGGIVSLTLGATADATDVLTVYKLAVPEADKDKVVVGAQLTIGGNLQNYVKDDAHTTEFLNGKVLEWGEIPERL